MVISATELAHKSSYGTGANWQSPTFNTVDGGEIWVAVMGGNATAFGIASNDGGWTFDNNISIGPTVGNYRIHIFRAVNTTGQSGRTVTVSSAAGDGYDVAVFQIEGDAVEIQRCTTVGAGGEPVSIGTLGSAATNGNFCLLIFGMNEDSNGASAMSVSGWTAESVNSWANANAFYGINVFSKSDFTGTSVSVTEYAISPTHGMGAIIELAEDTGVPLAPEIRGWATATNTADALPAVVLNLPTRVAGDLLLAFGAEDSATALTHSQTTTWTELSDEAGTGANRLGVYARIATNDANDALSVAGANSADASFNVVAIKVGTHSVVNVATDIVKVSAATGASGNANPPSINGGSSKNWLAIAAACVDLTATGSAITAAPTSYTTDAITQKSAASTSSVALGVGPRRMTATQTEDPGVFTNTSGAWIAKTLLIPPVPPAPNDGAATGSIAWAGSADGETPISTQEGSASGSISWVGSATGTTIRRGSANGTIGWAGVAVGGNLGVVIGGIGWSGSSVGSSVHRGANVGAIAWVGSANGETPLDIFDGSANGAITWAGSIIGSRSSKGDSNGAVTWSGIAIGGNLGIAIGAIIWVGVATGVRAPKGEPTGAVAWSGSSVGSSIRRGASSGTIAWVGSANGETPPDLVGGSTSGDIIWSGSVLGLRPAKGSSVGTIGWAGVVVGGNLGIGIGSIIWGGIVVGSKFTQGFSEGTISWVGLVTAPFAVDPSIFLLSPHITGYKSTIVNGYKSKIVVGHKPLITKGRDGG
jgi:hypothetical protein